MTTTGIQASLDAIERDVMDAIEAEEELPGEMPDEMWAAICGDRGAATASLQLAVKETKKGIKGRVAKIFKRKP